MFNFIIVNFDYTPIIFKFILILLLISINPLLLLIIQNFLDVIKFHHFQYFLQSFFEHHYLERVLFIFINFKVL